MPSSIVPKLKRKKRSKETRKGEVETMEPAASGRAVIPENSICGELKEGEMVTRIISKEIYDFSDS
jgi:hypothetical protein